MLAELEEIAKEKSSERRRELMRSLTDLFLLDDTVKTEIHIQLYDDIITKIISDVETEARVELAERIAPAHDAPKGVIMRLALDEISVAAPVLKQSPLLSDDDLIAVAKNKSQEHMLAISERSYVSEKVTDVLIDHGDNRVHHSVVVNDGARVSDKKMNVLLTFAEHDPALIKTLQDKREKQKHQIESLVSELNTELEKRLNEKNIAVSEDAQLFFDALLNNEVRGRMFREKVERINVKVLAQKIRDGEMLAEGAFLKLANSDQFIEVGTLLGEIHDLPQDSGIECLMNSKIEPLLILMKAAGCTERGMEAVLKMRSRRLNLTMNYDPVLATFNSLTPDMAARVIRFLKIRKQGEAAGAEQQSVA